MKKIITILALLFFSVPHSLIGASASTTQVTWTSAETSFIQQNQTLTLGVDPEFVPFEFIENGDYKGITADYVDLISQRTGIDFDVQMGFTFEQAYAATLAGEIDIMPALSKTTNRETQFTFSDMYYQVKRVIVTKNDNTTIKGIEDLYGLTVAVQRNSSHHTYLLSYPEINFSLYETVNEALTAVSVGEELVFVGNLATSDYLIKTSALTNLRFSALSSDQPLGIHFAVANDHPDRTILIQVINKALDSLTDSEKNAIHSRWVSVSTAIDYGPIIQVVISVAILVVIIGLVSFFWIWQLRKEVAVRKQTQISLEKAKVEAEEANKVKSTFMARMSHEIRTPLNAITGMSYLIKKSSEISPAQRMYAERITQASQTMLNLINDILDYSKIEASKVELEHISFNLDQVIHNLMSIIALKVEDKGLGFRFARDTDVPTWLIGDPKRLEQILLNLVNNAVKFTEKGEISLEIKNRAVEYQTHYLDFVIKDTGIGMSKDVLDHLFQPFTQADASITRRYGGSGLGLSIVKHLVELMGGEVKVYSTVGQGTSFVVSIAFEADSQKQLEEQQENNNEFIKQLRVLVLDKNSANLNIIETYLHAFGIACELTTSADAAMSILEKANRTLNHPFDLLIIDYDTPQEKGLAFVTQLRVNSRLVKMPKTIMLLPMQRSDLFDQLLEHGVEIGIGKPVISSILHNAILEIFIHQALTNIDHHQHKEEPVAKVNKTILIVDDNNTNQLIARLLLEGSGFDVLLAGNGEEGVKVYGQNSQKIAAVLMDIHMPVMDGYTASRKLKTLNPQLTIIAMTAEVTGEVRKNCLEAGMDHYISKPFEPEHFVQMIRDIIQSNDHDIHFKTAPIDVKRGIKHLGDNADLYALVVKEYYQENKNTIGDLDACIATQNYLGARQLLHKIKGSSATMWSTNLVKSRL